MSVRTQYHITHETRYRYAADVAHSHHLLHLVPRPAPYQQCLEHSLQITPAPTYRRDEIDAFGNPVTRVEFQSPYRALTVTTSARRTARAPYGFSSYLAQLDAGPDAASA